MRYRRRGTGSRRRDLRALAFALHEELKPAGVHVVTVTIEGAIGSRPRFMPDAIADAYWDLHAANSEQWVPEREYRD